MSKESRRGVFVESFVRKVQSEVRKERDEKGSKNKRELEDGAPLKSRHYSGEDSGTALEAKGAFPN